MTPASVIHARVDGESGRRPEPSGDFAAGAAATWQAIDAALSPIIGQRGVVTLFQRSLHRTATTVPCFATAPDDAMQPGDFGPLQALLAALPLVEATAAHEALLQTFHDLLASLIGPSLTERLLRSVAATLDRTPAVTHDRRP